MKLLTSTALSLLLISLASVSYGQVETINYSDGGVYVGEVRNGQRNGQGSFQIRFWQGMNRGRLIFHIYISKNKSVLTNSEAIFVRSWPEADSF